MQKSFFLLACVFFILVSTVSCRAEMDLSRITLPEGFHIEIYAADVPGARSLSLSPSGVLFVGTRSEGKVYALLDADKDFKADKILTIASGLNMPNGVALMDGDLYVAEVHRVIRYRDIEKKLSNPGQPEVINDSFPEETHHGWKFIAFGPDKKLYVPVGAPCNVCNPEDPIFSTITRMNADGSGLEIYAKGIRNTVGFDWHPETNVLWFTDNGRDWMGDNKPPDELNRAPEPGLHFGFPFYHGKNISDPEFSNPPDDFTHTQPVQELGPHVASLGMRFYTGEMFPSRYHNQIFIAEHGSWNRSVPIGYRITLVTLDKGLPASYDVFARGWLRNGSKMGRPVDVEIMEDGSMLVSDDYSGTVYRITYRP